MQREEVSREGGREGERVDIFMIFSVMLPFMNTWQGHQLRACSISITSKLLSFLHREHIPLL
jgi:hypothetical protein